MDNTSIREILLTPWMAIISAVILLLLFLCRRREAEHTPADSLIVITGCDSGFGEMAAKRLSSEGYKVIACCLTEEGQRRIEGITYKSIICDVTKSSDIERISDEVKNCTNTGSLQLWALINNAGIAPIGYLDWLSTTSIRRAMEVNYFGLVDMTKMLLPHLKHCRGSRIVNLSSMAGIVAGPGFSAYSASKHALEGLTKSLRTELRPWGIHACNINPAFMRTPLIESSIIAAKNELANAPDDIKDQYPPEVLDASMKTILNVQENPIKVVNAVCRAVKDACPPRNYYVGLQAAALNILLSCFPAFIVEWLGSLTEDETSHPKREVVSNYQNRRRQ